MNRKCRCVFVVLSEIIVDVIFGDFFSIVIDDKCQFIEYVPDIMTFVGLSLGFKGWVGCCI